MSYNITGYGNWTYLGMENGMAKYERVSTASVKCAYCNYTSSGTLTEYDYKSVHSHAAKVTCAGTDRHLYYCGNSTHVGVNNACGYIGYYEAHSMSGWGWDGSRFFRNCTVCGYKEYETSLAYFNYGGDYDPQDKASSIQALVNSLYVNILGRSDGSTYGNDAWVSGYFANQKSLQTIVLGIVESPEAQGKSWYGNTDTWVRQLYKAMLHREVDSSYTDWVNKLNSGVYSRRDVVIQIMKSAEFGLVWNVVYSNDWESASPTSVTISTHPKGYENFGAFGGNGSLWKKPKGYVVSGNYWHLENPDRWFGDSSISVTLNGNSKVYMDWKVQKVKVFLYRNFTSTDGTVLAEEFVYGDSGNRLGYYPWGGARYNPMAAADKGFGTWTRSGYYLGTKSWSSSRNGDGVYETYQWIDDDWIADKCGNSERTDVSLFLQWNAIPPTIGVRYEDFGGNTYYPGNWTNRGVKVIAITNDGGSGYPSGYIAWNGEGYGSSNVRSFSASGTYEGTVKVRNNAGLTASANWGKVMVDVTKPSLTDKAGGKGTTVGEGSAEYGWTNKSQKIKYSAYDAHSGLAGLVISNSWGTSVASGTDTVEYTVTGEGISDYIVKAWDRVGNTSSMGLRYKIDYRAPVYNAKIVYAGKTVGEGGEIPLSSVIAIDRAEYENFQVVISADDYVPGIDTSGIKTFYAVVGNLDNMSSRRYEASFSEGTMKAEISITVDSQDTLFMGQLGVYVYLKDVAGNVTEITDNLGVFTLDAYAESLYSEDLSVFPQGSSGLLKFVVSGYACEVKIQLPDIICRESYEGEFGQDIQVKDFSYILSEADFVNNGRAYGERQFYIPLYCPEGQYEIEVTAIKTGSEIIYNPITDKLETTGILSVVVPIDIKGSVLDDLYTSLR